VKKKKVIKKKEFSFEDEAVALEKYLSRVWKNGDMPCIGESGFVAMFEFLYYASCRIDLMACDMEESLLTVGGHIEDVRKDIERVKNLAYSSAERMLEHSSGNTLSDTKKPNDFNTPDLGKISTKL
jgi:hypothetical protein